MSAVVAIRPMQQRPITHHHTASCSTCGLKALCLPGGLAPESVSRIDAVVSVRRRLKRGEKLYRAGDPFIALYAVRRGFLKTLVAADDGRDQVMGFPMTGEVIGMDGIETEHHRITAVALEDSEVCVIPFARLEELAGQVRDLQRQLNKVMSREIVRDQGIMMMLGTMRGEERVAAFLLNLSQRFQARGFAATEFLLRMTREEIGSYLGLKLETVSRILSRLQETGLIEVDQKHVVLRDRAGLKALLNQPTR